MNQKVKHVEYDKFYIPEISSLVDIQEDYLMWFLHQAGMVRGFMYSHEIAVHVCVAGCRSVFSISLMRVECIPYRSIYMFSRSDLSTRWLCKIDLKTKKGCQKS